MKVANAKRWTPLGGIWPTSFKSSKYHLWLLCGFFVLPFLWRDFDVPNWIKYGQAVVTCRYEAPPVAKHQNFIQSWPNDASFTKGALYTIATNLPMEIGLGNSPGGTVNTFVKQTKVLQVLPTATLALTADLGRHAFASRTYMSSSHICGDKWTQFQSSSVKIYR